MKKWIVFSVLVLFAFALLNVSPAQAADKPMKLRTCWMPEHETFIAWYAKEKGWDKEEGLDLELLFFDSGMAQMEALPAKQWALGGTGGTPMVVGAARYNAVLFGIGNDESLTNVVMVRADSPIMKVKGSNPKFPEVYGSAELIKGKTILCTTVSSAHFALSSWLKVFGLKDSDVVIKNMDQAQAVAAFESGIGDVVSLWAPHLYSGLKKGWKIAGSIKACGAGLPIVLVGDKEFCDKNPETVAKFLRVYFRGIDYLKSTPVDKVVPEYKKFMKDWCGLDMNEEMCKMDIEMHPVFNLEEQLKMFDNSKGMNVPETWEMGVLNFFTEQGKLKKEDVDKVVKDGKPTFVTDKYLKMVKK
ncbi:MAG: ABC transporter substrate-binding protein [Syntrophobacteraceae bacterium]|nr:ABC transporter substrate-binding protein [Desulfobacteraceae bacterium]